MDSLYTKLLCTFLMGSLSLLLGILPLKLSVYIEWSSYGGRIRNHVTSLLLCFGAGVLFATCFIHMIPEVRDGLQHAFNNTNSFPYTEIIVSCGFFLIYLIEEIISTLAQYNGVKISHLSDIHDEVVYSENIPKTKLSSEVTQTLGEQIGDVNPKYAGSLSDSARTMFPNYNSPESIPKKTLELTILDFITILSLSFHTIFEGLAIGIEPKGSSEVWKLFTAIIIHKFVLIFCVGLELISAQTPTWIFYTYISIFAMMSPFGTLIGIALSSTNSHYATTSVLQGLAAGTILYVVVFEILRREREKKNIHGLLQWLFVIIGYSFMVVIELFAGHLHNHQNSNGFCNTTTTSL